MKNLWLPLAALVMLFVCQRSTLAQSGLRESLERLDRNQNGEIEPSEITPLSRPYLERIAGSRNLSLDRPNGIDKLQEAARIYYALKNGVSGNRIDPSDKSTVTQFGAIAGEPLVPEFGLADIKFPYTQVDLDEADDSLRRSDRNRDGYIDREEAARSEWRYRDPFDEDADQDNRLSRLELAQRYARRRLLEGTKNELVQKVRRVGSGVQPVTPVGRDSQFNDSRSWMRGGSRYYLTASVMERFDLNRNGRLEPNESAKLGFPVGRIDIDRDGVLSRDEMFAFLSEWQDEVGDDSEGLPTWFFERDLNRDDQVEMAEFTDEWTDELLEQFAALDMNEDGILTSLEVAQSKAMMGGSYSNMEAEVLPPRKTIISEIVVDDNFLIGDLNVELTITHTYVSHLDAYLTGPDGQRIELFTEVGGSDDHFEQTIFDDQASTPITKARAPFSGAHLPEAILKGQPSLNYFKGKSVQGVWQLVVSGTRSERFGMLHSWGLRVRPEGDTLAVAETPISPDSTSAPPTNASDLTSYAPASGRSDKKEQREDRDSRKSIEAMPQAGFDGPDSSRKALKGDRSEAEVENYKRELKEKYLRMLESKKVSGGKQGKFD